jgi:hypothetical protein
MLFKTLDQYLFVICGVCSYKMESGVNEEMVKIFSDCSTCTCWAHWLSPHQGLRYEWTFTSLHNISPSTIIACEVTANSTNATVTFELSISICRTNYTIFTWFTHTIFVALSCSKVFSSWVCGRYIKRNIWLCNLFNI